MTENRVVSSYNDWDPLEEVIVGTPYHLDYTSDLSFRLFFHDNIAAEPGFQGPRGRWSTFGEKPTNLLRDESLEDLEQFIGVLNDAGVTVRRPTVVDEVKRVMTPWWSSAMGHAMMSRDLFIVVGDEIIETSPMVRSRYFEADLYKELLTEYFRRGARWTVAPRSRLLAENFDYTYAVAHGYADDVPAEQFHEIMFDGPQVLRLGQDLVFNCSTENHRMGCEWLQRHLGPDYIVHEICIADHHIDAMLVALRPGCLLVKRGVDLQSIPDELAGWNVIWYDPLLDYEYRPDGWVPFLASNAIGMNVLSLDEERVIVQQGETTLMRNLERSGFTPIECRWRHPRALGGGFHCMTLDIRRHGTLQRYLQ